MMSSSVVSIICSLIAFAASILVAVINTNNQFKDIMAELKAHNAVQDERITRLTEEVKKHNSIVERTYNLEKEVEILKSKNE